MLFALSAVFLMAMAAPWLGRLPSRMAGWVLSLVPLALTFFFLGKLGAVADGRTLTESWPWVPGLGVDLSFYLDGLSLMFTLLITGVGTLIFIYAGRYFHEAPAGRFFLWLSVFTGAMLGLVLAGNLITLFVFWELTSISSYFLIATDHKKESARKAALQALLVTGLGGQAFLAGSLLLGMAGGSLEIADLLTRGEAVRSHGLYLPALLLILAGAFTKSAQVPFHFWLPSAMEAPTPVSAFLHSVTMVKAGVYLLARLSPVLGGTEAWTVTVAAIGCVTMVAGAVMALFQSDMKRLLAYSTVNALGTMVFLLGIGTETAVKAAIVYVLVHSLYKGALFLVAGVVDHETGSRNVTSPRRLFRKMPIIASSAVLAGLSMAGLPPFFGYIGKELIYEGALKAPFAGFLLPTAAVTANLFLFATAALLVLRPFFGGTGETPPFHISPPEFFLGPAILGLSSLAVGIFPGLVDSTLIAGATKSVLAREIPVHLALWHGINTAFLLGILTFGAGVLLYAFRDSLERCLQGATRFAALGPARWYEWSLAVLNGTAVRQTRLLQHGRLNLYVLILFMTIAGLGLYTFFRGEGGWVLPNLLDARISEATVAGLILASAFLSIASPSRLAAVVAMGGVGYGVALIYVQFGAPDVAMTQFAVETVTVILFVLVIHRLPSYVRLSSRTSRMRDGIIALGTGGLMTLLVLAVLETGNESRLSGFFAEQAYPEGHGRNIVNVILVDFRALDTMGEITVLSLAGLGVYGLLKIRKRKEG